MLVASIFERPFTFRLATDRLGMFWWHNGRIRLVSLKLYSIQSVQYLPPGPSQTVCLSVYTTPYTDISAHYVQRAIWESTTGKASYSGRRKGQRQQAEDSPLVWAEGHGSSSGRGKEEAGVERRVGSFSRRIRWWYMSAFPLLHWTQMSSSFHSLTL